LIIWLVIGLVIYFTYSRHHSKVQLANRAGMNSKPTPTMAD
jgi:hypothetical protein